MKKTYSMTAIAVSLCMFFVMSMMAHAAFVQSAVSTGGAVTSTVITVNTTKGNTIVIIEGESAGSTVATTTDSAGNAYTLVGNVSRTANEQLAEYYSANALAISSATCIATTAGTSLHCNLFEISAVPSVGGLDTFSLASTTLNQTSWSSTPITTTNANDILLYGARGSANQTSYTPGTGFTFPSNASTVRSAFTYESVTSTQSGVSTTITVGATAAYDSIFSAFKQIVSVSSTADVTIRQASFSKGITIR